VVLVVRAEPVSLVALVKVSKAYQLVVREVRIRVVAVAVAGTLHPELAAVVLVNTSSLSSTIHLEPIAIQLEQLEVLVPVLAPAVLGDQVLS